MAPAPRPWPAPSVAPCCLPANIASKVVSSEASTVYIIVIPLSSPSFCPLPSSSTKPAPPAECMLGITQCYASSLPPFPAGLVFREAQSLDLPWDGRLVSAVGGHSSGSTHLGGRWGIQSLQESWWWPKADAPPTTPRDCRGPHQGQAIPSAADPMAGNQRCKGELAFLTCRLLLRCLFCTVLLR